MLGDWSLLLAAIIDRVELAFCLFLLFDKYLKNEVSLERGFYVVRFMLPSNSDFWANCATFVCLKAQIFI